MTPEEVIAQIKARHKRGLPMNAGAVHKENNKLFRYGKRHYGNWEGAMEEAGLLHLARKIRSPAMVKRQVQAWVDKYGPMMPSKIKETDPSLYNTLRFRFGSIKKAAHELGFEYASKNREWTPGMVMRELRKIEKEHGSLEGLALAHSHPALSSAARRIFGNMHRAQRMAGCKTTTYYRRVWDSEKIKAALEEYIETVGPLTTTGLLKFDCGLACACQKRFGGVQAAARKFGLPYGKNARRWPPTGS